MALSRRETLRRTIETRWDDLLAPVEGLSGEQMVESRVMEDWSAKDILTHSTTWEAEVLHHLPTVAERKNPPAYASQYSGIAAFNALKFEENHTWPLDEVLARLHETRTLAGLSGNGAGRASAQQATVSHPVAMG